MKIVIVGGVGYIGSHVVLAALDQGYEVTVFDLMIYDEKVLPEHKNLTKIKGDIRNTHLLDKSIYGHEIVIHLACISYDPSFELNPSLGKSITTGPGLPDWDTYIASCIIFARSSTALTR